jgi:succinoglycan biosynthesis transport protein ExoP
MNVMRNDLLDAADRGPVVSTGEPRREIVRLVRMARRSWLTILIAVVITTALGLLFVMIVEPSYRSTIRILLDQNRTGEVGGGAGLSQETNVDEYIATQVAMFQSDVITKRVAEKLALDGERRLVLRELPVAQETSRDVAAEPTEEDNQAVVDALRRTLSVYRLDRSFVVELAVTSSDAALSQSIADAIGAAYISDQSESYAQSLTQAGNWLEERIEDLRRQSLEASQVVERFRAASGIRSTEGQLISDQQLTGLSNQYVLAEANVSRLQSRYDVYSAAVSKGDITALVGLRAGGEQDETSAPLVALGTDYLNAAERERRVAATFGQNNAQLPAIRAELERLSRQVLDEARRQLASYGSELAAARTQLVNLEGSMQSAAGRSENSNVPLVQLRSLEQRANSLQTLYQTYLQRYQETLQRQSLPLNGARMISGAEQASRPVFPNTKIVLAFAVIFGLGAGAAVSVGREFFDNSVRTADDLRALGVELIGSSPRQGAGAMTTEIARLRRALAAATKPHAGAGKPMLVCVVSCRPGEGRTFLTETLANALAYGGQAVALFDFSAEAPASKGPATDGKAAPGIRTKPAAASRLVEGIDTLTFDGGLSSYPDLRRLLLEGSGSTREALSRYDVILLDLPPIGTAIEARGLADAVDAIVLAVEWGRTDRDLVAAMLASGPTFRSKVSGAVLTKVNPSEMRKYDPGSTSADRP